MEKTLKCGRCGKPINIRDGWKVELMPVKPGASSARFYICNDCRIIWQIAMGQWLESHGKESKESVENGGKEETGSAEEVPSSDNDNR